MLDSNSRLLRYHLLRALIICCLICFSFKTVPAHAQAPNFGWAEVITSSSGSVWWPKLATENNGSIHVIGNYGDDLSLGGLALTNVGSGQGFVAKCDAGGHAIWLKAIGDPSHLGSSTLSNLVVDPFGNTLVGGYFNHRSTVGSFILTNSDIYAQTPFIAKYDPAGNVIWAKTLSTNSAYLTQLALDSSNNIYLTGTVFGTVNFDGISLVSTNSGTGTSFFAKYDANGNIQWAQLVSGKCRAIAVDSAGNGFLTGGFSRVATFGSISLTNSSFFGTDANIFVARFDSAGNWLWAAQAGGADGDDYGNTIAVDAGGNCYVSGYYHEHFSPASFGPIALPGLGFDDGFLAKYSPSGTVLWAIGLAGTGQDSCNALALDQVGNVLVEGQYVGGAISLGSLTMTNGGGAAIFVAKFSSDGNALWAKQVVVGSVSTTGGGGVGVDMNNNTYLLGSLYGQAIFDNITVTSPAGNGLFLSRINGPEVSIQPMNQQLLISWPTNAVGLHLESATDLNVRNWSPVPNATTVVGTQNTVTVNASGSSQFFRLSGP